MDSQGNTEHNLHILPDYIKENLDMIVIGLNPSLTSAQIGHYFAGPGNHFWSCMSEVGLVPEPVTCYDDSRMVDYGIGFTNACARPTKGAADLTKKELKDGMKSLLSKLQRYNPKVVVFNGKGTYEIFIRHKHFGMGKQPNRVEGTNSVIFVMPSSSARCAQLPRAADKIPFFAALKELRDKVRHWSTISSSCSGLSSGGRLVPIEEANGLVIPDQIDLELTRLYDAGKSNYSSDKSEKKRKLSAANAAAVAVASANNLTNTNNNSNNTKSNNFRTNSDDGSRSSSSGVSLDKAKSPSSITNINHHHHNNGINHNSNNNHTITNRKKEEVSNLFMPNLSNSNPSNPLSCTLSSLSSTSNQQHPWLYSNTYPYNNNPYSIINPLFRTSSSSNVVPPHPTNIFPPPSSNNYNIPYYHNQHKFPPFLPNYHPHHSNTSSVALSNHFLPINPQHYPPHPHHLSYTGQHHQQQQQHHNPYQPQYLQNHQMQHPQHANNLQNSLINIETDFQFPSKAHNTDTKSKEYDVSRSLSNGDENNNSITNMNGDQLDCNLHQSSATSSTNFISLLMSDSISPSPCSPNNNNNNNNNNNINNNSSNINVDKLPNNSSNTSVSSIDSGIYWDQQNNTHNPNKSNDLIQIHHERLTSSSNGSITTSVTSIQTINGNNNLDQFLPTQNGNGEENDDNVINNNCIINSNNNNNNNEFTSMATSFYSHQTLNNNNNNNNTNTNTNLTDPTTSSSSSNDNNNNPLSSDCQVSSSLCSVKETPDSTSRRKRSSSSLLDSANNTSSVELNNSNNNNNNDVIIPNKISLLTNDSNNAIEEVTYTDL